MEDKTEKDPGGRPTKYLPKYAKEVFKLCLLGATDKEIADFFEVAESTVNLWKLEHKKFSESIRAGKRQADTQVANSLYRRALGYTFDEIHSEKLDIDGSVTVTDKGELSNEPTFRKKMIKKEVAPDVNAAIFWLKNRRPDLWRDKTEVDNNVSIKEYNIGFADETDKDKAITPKS
jgi:hypothetical protein